MCPQKHFFGGLLSLSIPKANGRERPKVAQTRLDHPVGGSQAGQASCDCHGVKLGCTEESEKQVNKLCFITD